MLNVRYTLSNINNPPHVHHTEDQEQVLGKHWARRTPVSERAPVLAPGIERHSMDVLEWLYDHPGEGLAGFPFDSSSNPRKLDELVSYLADRQLVADQSTFGGTDATILPGGIAAVEQLRVARAAPAQRARRAATVRTHLLWWLDGQDTPAADLSGALAGLDVDDLGTKFTIKDVNREAAYLKDKALINGIRTWQSTGLMRPAPDGCRSRTCVTDFGGNVSDYLNAQPIPQQLAATVY